MSVRLVLAVVVAAALLGAAMPVVEDARHDVAATGADRAAQDVADAVTDLVRSGDPVPRGVPGGRRVVAVAVPERATVVVGSAANGSVRDGATDDVIAARVPPATERRTRVDADVRVVRAGVVRQDDEPLVLREDERIVLQYVLVDGDPTVTVERV